MRRYLYWRVLLPDGVPSEGEADAVDETAMLAYLNDLNRSAMLGDGARGRWHYWMDAQQRTSYTTAAFHGEHRGSRR